MAKKEIYTTPAGIAQYPYLRRPEVFDGAEVGYTIQMLFEQADLDALEKFILDELEKAQGLPEFAGKKWKNPAYGFRENKDGDILVKFKTKASFVSKKSGEVITKTLPVFDAEGKPIPANISPSSGSVCKVAYSVAPYHKGKNCGLILYLEAVQVLELKTYEGTGASTFGFGKEEGGYVADENVVDDEGSPFTDDGNDADF